MTIEEIGTIPNPAVRAIAYYFLGYELSIDRVLNDLESWSQAPP